MNKQSVIGLGLVIAVLWAAATFTRPFLTLTTTDAVPASVTKVRIANGSGDVRVRQGERAEVATRAEAWWPWMTAHPRVEGDTLVLADCGFMCSASYDVTVQRPLEITGDAGSGSVRLDGTGRVALTAGSGDVTVTASHGTVEVRAGSGRITVEDAASAVTVQAGSGDIELLRVRGAVSAEAGSGSVEVALASTVDVRAKTGSGDITVQVPQGSTWNVAGNSGSGDRDVTVKQASGVPHTLTLDSGSGDVEAAER